MIQQGMINGRTGLQSYVLVLNRSWRAIRVTNAKSAFGLIFRDAAEVIRVDDRSYSAHDFPSWLSLGRAEPSAVFGQSNGNGHLNPQAYSWVQAVSFRVAVPQVIRLLLYDRLPSRNIKLSRRNVFARDRNRCQYCREHFPNSQLSVDHVIPRSQGGRSTWENLVCCCMACNSRKGGRTPDQANMQLSGKPKKPEQHMMLDTLGHSRFHSSWRLFLDRAGPLTDMN